MSLINPANGFCWECTRGYCSSCLRSGCACGHNPDTVLVHRNTEREDSEPQETDSDDEPAYVRTRSYKPDAAVTDQQSTGRKRAAKLYPLDEKKACEWRDKPTAGGGANPIVPCTSGTQQARHHGPDKNTLNNEPGNVHRICHTCHVRWHAANDNDYDPNKPLKN